MLSTATGTRTFPSNNNLKPPQSAEGLQFSSPSSLNRRVIDEDDEDDEEGVARNLLGFRDQNNWGPPAAAGGSAAGSVVVVSSENGENKIHSEYPLHKMGEIDISAALAHTATTNIISYYEPKFFEIFMAYSKTTAPNKGVDVKLPLLSMCLEHLIPFNCWVRESNTRLQWIRNVLDDNADLRPEVRNGLSMVYIYSFSAGKATIKAGSDMFTVLQDAESGFGIVNKTSLKIYNDPFNFFGFIKACISGLIDCGKLPENERQNQPKKPKKSSASENRDELAAFLQLKAYIVSVLNRGDNNTARSKVEQIMMAWQYRPKEVRTRRFGIAIAVLNNQISVADIPAHLVVPLSAVVGGGGAIGGGGGRSMVMSGGGNNALLSTSSITSSSVGALSASILDGIRPLPLELALTNPLGGTVVQGVSKQLMATSTTPMMIQQQGGGGSSSSGGSSTSSHSSSSSLGSLISLANASSSSVALGPLGDTKNQPQPRGGGASAALLASFVGSNSISSTSGVVPAGGLQFKNNNKRQLTSTPQPQQYTGGAALAAKNKPSSDDLFSYSKNNSGGTNKASSSNVPAASSAAPRSGVPVNLPTTTAANNRSSSSNGTMAMAAAAGVQQMHQAHQMLAASQMTNSSLAAGRGAGPGGVLSATEDHQQHHQQQHINRGSDDIYSLTGIIPNKAAPSSNTLGALGAASSSSSSGGAVLAVTTGGASFAAASDHEQRSSSSSQLQQQQPAYKKSRHHQHSPQDHHSGGAIEQHDARGGGGVSLKQQQSSPVPVPAPPRIIKALRFERVGLKEWHIKETRLFSIDGLLANNAAATICLIDEANLSSDEVKDGRLKSSTSGLATLQAELSSRHVLITTWPKCDYAHLSDFVSSWQRQQQPFLSSSSSWSGGGGGFQSSSVAPAVEPSLTKYWHSLTAGAGETGSPATHPTQQRGDDSGGGSGANRSPIGTSPSPSPQVSNSVGALAYEVNMQIGVILRSCSEAGISEDCWRMIYPSDLHEEVYSASFASFLSSFFPQLRAPFSRLKDLQSVVVKYYPHQVQLPLVQPPAKLESLSYQTLGTIDEDAGTILKRLETSITLHDFVLQVT